ncbi:(2Fe-2S)-binding protein [Proteinivorax hydrogeniformans]|uniref:(2Fe-2S)-binding protein n=1 Tax=Proteinivorax hydrogeniformans TaxID=1826727 RepID=A0AAU8HWD5_9FIRM
MKDNVIVCRCEDVTVGEIKKLVADGINTPEEIKRITRMSMGCCQGRTCGGILQQILSNLLNEPVDEIKLWEKRPPAKPVLMKALIGGDTDES